MGKEQELVQAVKAEDVGTAQRLLQRPRPGKASECGGRGAGRGGGATRAEPLTPWRGRGMLPVPGGGAGPVHTRTPGRWRRGGTESPAVIPKPQRAPGGTHLPGLGIGIPPSLPASVPFSPRPGLWAGSGRSPLGL